MVKGMSEHKLPLTDGIVELIKAKCSCALLLCAGQATWVQGCADEGKLYEQNVAMGEVLKSSVTEARKLAGEAEGAQLLTWAQEAYSKAIIAHRRHLMQAFGDVVSACEYNLFGINVYYPHGGLRRNE
jgi:hypothetical protein